MILSENTTPEEVSKFILEATEDEINEAFSSEDSFKYMKGLSDKARDKLNDTYKKVMGDCILDIIDIMKKGGYENL